MQAARSFAPPKEFDPKRPKEFDPKSKGFP